MPYALHSPSCLAEGDEFLVELVDCVLARRDGGVGRCGPISGCTLRVFDILSPYQVAERLGKAFEGSWKLCGEFLGATRQG